MSTTPRRRSWTGRARGQELTFPAPKQFELVVAALNAEGVPDFLEAPAAAAVDIAGAFTGAWYWKVEGGHALDNVGGGVVGSGLAGPNGSSLGVLCFPAHSAGKLDLTDARQGVSNAHVVPGSDKSMHATQTIDYEIVISGKVDIVLPGNKVRTLRPGSLLVMGGVPHSWQNHYDEDCVYIAVTVGFNA